MSPENAQTVFSLLTMLIGTSATPPPKSMSKEWQEASNERARELNLDPITGKYTESLFPTPRFYAHSDSLLGVPSEGYSGKGFVQSK